jgi:hypothetical protein
MVEPGNAEVNGPRTCSVCGTASAVGGGIADLAWSTAVEDGRRLDLCPDCTRRNVRSIEGKLPEQWW